MRTNQDLAVNAVPQQALMDFATDDEAIVRVLREIYRKLQALYVAQGARLPNDVYMAMLYAHVALINHDNLGTGLHQEGQ
jgi:hypothetical protein